MAVYLDNNATTSMSSDVLDAMMPFLTDRYQNVSSAAGEVSGLRRALSQARTRVATLLDVADSAECVFTSGATEANNWAIEGTARNGNGVGHVVTTAIEHPSVLESVRRLEQESGWSVSVVKPDYSGVITVEDILKVIRPETKLVSVMLVNNETGILQPVGAISRAVKAIAPTTTFHTDATQALGKIGVSLSGELGTVDLLSLSAHKFHGPKGVGVLVVRAGTNIAPLLVGGGQESGRRSGTTNMPGVVGCGAAAIAARLWESHRGPVQAMRDRFEEILTSQFPSVLIFGRDQDRLPNTSCFALPGCDGNSIADRLALENIWVGTGSACSAGALRPPHSLLAMGIPYSTASAALRVSLSRYSSNSDIDQLINALSIIACNATTATRREVGR
jgi:cysteine desulfurase